MTSVIICLILIFGFVIFATTDLFNPKCPKCGEKLKQSYDGYLDRIVWVCENCITEWI